MRLTQEQAAPRRQEPVTPAALVFVALLVLVRQCAKSMPCFYLAFLRAPAPLRCLTNKTASYSSTARISGSSVLRGRRVHETESCVRRGRRPLFDGSGDVRGNGTLPCRGRRDPRRRRSSAAVSARRALVCRSAQRT